MDDLTEFFGEPIAVYTTTQALADGTLVDAGDLARELFRWPVLLTTAAWHDCVGWTEQDTERTGSYGQSETGRLWDVLWMTRCALDGAAGDQRSVQVQLYRIPREADRTTELEAELVTLRAAVGFHDDGSPLLVVGFPEED